MKNKYLSKKKTVRVEQKKKRKLIFLQFQNPLEVDLVINLPHDGVRLIFDPVVQRLKIIEIYNMKSVKLKYCSLPFNSPEVLPSIEQIEHSFGATHPGVYDSDKQVKKKLINQPVYNS